MNHDGVEPCRLRSTVMWQRALFIRRNAEAGKPFFTYVCFTQMHPSLIHHPDFKGRDSDTVAEVDYRTGHGALQQSAARSPNSRPGQNHGNQESEPND